MKLFIKGLGLFTINKIIANIPFHFIRIFFYKRLYLIGKGSSFLMNVRFLTLRKNIILGKNSVIGYNSQIDGRGEPVIIGNNVDIANNVFIYTLQHSTQKSNHETSAKRVVINDYAWIASRATILPGVIVGEGAVIGAASVVTQNVPPYEIWAGNPAKKIGIRTKKLTYKLNHKPWFE